MHISYCLVENNEQKKKKKLKAFEYKILTIQKCMKIRHVSEVYKNLRY